MNIFVLDSNPILAAQAHVDKHVVKMPLETAQLLCTAHHISGTNPEQIPYRMTHRNHPCALWTRESLQNYRWLVDLGLAICGEYTHRYGKVHKSQAVIEWCGNNEPSLNDSERTPFVQAMPSDLRSDDPVESYRRYYLLEKSHLFSWKKRKAPEWITASQVGESILKTRQADHILSLKERPWPK